MYVQHNSRVIIWHMEVMRFTEIGVDGLRVDEEWVLKLMCYILVMTENMMYNVLSRYVFQTFK